jgi:hypothetical protein
MVATSVRISFTQRECRLKNKQVFPLSGRNAGQAALMPREGTCGETHR